MAQESFLYRDVPAFRKRTFRLGLAGTYGIDEKGMAEVLEGPCTYVFWNPTARALTRVLRTKVPRERERFIIATGPTLGLFPFNLRRATERALRELKTDYLDVLQLYWLSKMSAGSDANFETMVRLQEEGKVRSIGCSIHDRVRAGKLAAEGPLDLFMIRYNAAHPGAEQDIFPHLAARKPAIVAYTATAWKKLLKAPPGWSEPVPPAGDCYRFCLTSPHVDVTLCGPASIREWQENLRSLERGPLTPEEMALMRRFGKAAHG